MNPKKTKNLLTRLYVEDSWLTERRQDAGRPEDLPTQGRQEEQATHTGPVLVL